ncbi:MAG: sortase [Candidatus Saccharimonas sp.]
MLAIRYQSSFSVKKMLLVMIIVACITAGLYVSSLFLSPAIAHRFLLDPISVSALPKPAVSDDRIIIPKLGINLNYSTSVASLISGAQWREQNLGNPADGGTMILIAHRLNIQSTPELTVTRSPFYALDTMAINDRLIVDYKGIRYGYEITSVHTGAVGDTSVPLDSSDDHLVLYTYDSDHDTRRTVVIAKPLGKVALTDK